MSTNQEATLVLTEVLSQVEDMDPVASANIIYGAKVAAGCQFFDNTNPVLRERMVAMAAVMVAAVVALDKECERG